MQERIIALEDKDTKRKLLDLMQEGNDGKNEDEETDVPAPQSTVEDEEPIDDQVEYGVPHDGPEERCTIFTMAEAGSDEISTWRGPRVEVNRIAIMDPTD